MRRSWTVFLQLSDYPRDVSKTPFLDLTAADLASVYQEFLARSLTDKYSMLSSQMDKIIHDANSEITSLRDKLSGTANGIYHIAKSANKLLAMHIEQKALEKKNHELAQSFKEKAASQQQLQKHYNKLKQQQFAAGMELAAKYDADHVIQASATGQHHASNHRSGQSLHSRGSNNSAGTSHRGQNAQPWEHQVQGNRQGLQNSRKSHRSAHHRMTSHTN